MSKKLLLFYCLTLMCFATRAQNISNFKGKVLTDGGAPLPGASVYLLNTNFGTSTNADGEFVLKRVRQGSYTIHIIALGYASFVKNIDVAGGQLVFQLKASAKQLDQVVVTAQKSEEDPQKLPVSITSLSAKQVEDYRVLNSKDLTALIPNLYSANPGDNRNVTSIRGMATTSYDPAVATYIDGVNQFGLDTYIAQLEDVERIEVLRGPQGTLYGRNAIGGVINIITKQPTNTTTGFAGLDFGNYKQTRYTLGLRAPLVKDKLFLGVSGLYTTRDGFYTNNFTHSAFDDQHSLMGNYYLKYLENSRLSFTLNVKHVANRNNGAFALAPDPVTALNEPFTVNQNNTTTLIDNIFNASLSVQYAGRGFNFTSQTAYQSNYRYYNQPIDGDFSTIDGVSIINNYGKDYNNVKVTTQEFRFTSPASSSSELKWVAGAYGFYENNPVKQTTHFGKDAAYVGAPFPFFSTTATNKQTPAGLAAFAQATYALSPELALTAGLRYDYQHEAETIHGEFQMDGQPAMVTRTDTSAKANFHALSPKVSLQYSVSQLNSVYAGYSRGFRTGGISQLSSDPSQPPLYAYSPELGNNFEAGSKNSFWDNRARLNISLFYTLLNNAQVPTLILPDAITVIRNAGKLESRGAELELALKPLNGFELAYNLGYTHARYTSLLVASNGAAVNLNGNRQVFTPDVTSMLAMQYSHAMGSQGLCKLVVHGDWRYLGKQYFDLANQIEQPAYSLFNARVGVDAKKLAVFLWASNLFNKHYIDYAYDFGATHLGNPKTYGISIKTSF